MWFALFVFILVYHTRYRRLLSGICIGPFRLIFIVITHPAKGDAHALVLRVARYGVPVAPRTALPLAFEVSCFAQGLEGILHPALVMPLHLKIAPPEPILTLRF